MSLFGGTICFRLESTARQYDTHWKCRKLFSAKATPRIHAPCLLAEHPETSVQTIGKYQIPAPKKKRTKRREEKSVKKYDDDYNDEDEVWKMMVYWNEINITNDFFPLAQVFFVGSVFCLVLFLQSYSMHHRRRFLSMENLLPRDFPFILLLERHQTIWNTLFFSIRVVSIRSIVSMVGLFFQQSRASTSSEWSIPTEIAICRPNKMS